MVEFVRRMTIVVKTLPDADNKQIFETRWKKNGAWEHKVHNAVLADHIKLLEDYGWEVIVKTR